MYAIYAYIDPQNHPNVGVYGIHGVSGICQCHQVFSLEHPHSIPPSLSVGPFGGLSDDANRALRGATERITPGVLAPIAGRSPPGQPPSGISGAMDGQMEKDGDSMRTF